MLIFINIFRLPRFVQWTSFLGIHPYLRNMTAIFIKRKYSSFARHKIDSFNHIIHTTGIPSSRTNFLDIPLQRIHKLSHIFQYYLCCYKTALKPVHYSVCFLHSNLPDFADNSLRCSSSVLGNVTVSSYIRITGPVIE
jgi:hypothetical protein